MWLWRLRSPKICIYQLATQESECYTAGLRTGRASGISCSLKTGRLKTQEGPMFPFGSKGRKIPVLQVHSQTGGIPSYLGRVSLYVLRRPSTWLDEAPRILGRAVCFTQYNSNVNNHPETILQTHSEWCLTKCLGTPGQADNKFNYHRAYL